MQAVFTQDASRVGKIHKRGRFGNVFALRDLWKREKIAFPLLCLIDGRPHCAIMRLQGGANDGIYRSILFPADRFFMLFFPEDIFEIMNSRRNEANGEPTRSFLIGTRIGGAIMMLIGIGGFVALLIERLSG